MILLGGGTGEIAGFEFLRSDIGARAGSMGGAYISASGDLHGIAYNPANIVDLENRSAAFTYIDHFMDFKQGFMGYGQSIQGHGCLGVGLFYMNYGEFQRTDVQGITMGSFSPSDFLLSVTYGDNLFRNLQYGVSLKYIQSKIDQYSSSALAADLGFIFKVPKEKLNFAFSIANLGKSIDAFQEDHEKLPVIVRMGLGKRLAHLPLLLNINIIKYMDMESDMFLGLYWALGGEFTISENIFLRLGYNSRGSEQKVQSESDRYAGISIGFGIVLDKYRIDYGRCSYGVIGTLNQFSISISL